MITRSEYMNGGATFAAYYAELAAALGVRFDAGDAFIVDRVRPAMAAGDSHLNTIPLVYWDGLAAHLCVSRAAGEVFRARGDSPSLAGLVCVYKSAARVAANAGA